MTLPCAEGDRAAHICIVTPGCLSNNPRVVREADALSSAGYAVTVVYAGQQAWTRPLDDAIAGRAQWTSRRISVDGHGWWSWVFRWSVAARSRLFVTAATLVPSCVHVAALAVSRYFFEQLVVCWLARADLYIAHYPGSIPIAAAAARLRRASFAVDAEDLHAEEVPESNRGALHRRLVPAVERRWLPEALYVSAPSPAIVDELRRRYGVSLAMAVLNTSPLSDGEPHQPASGSLRDDRVFLLLVLADHLPG